VFSLLFLGTTHTSFSVFFLVEARLEMLRFNFVKAGRRTRLETANLNLFTLSFSDEAWLEALTLNYPCALVQVGEDGGC